MSEATAAMLRGSIPLALDWSSSQCRPCDNDRFGCSAIHGLWQILRYLGMNTTPDHHRDFFRTHLMEYIQSGARRVLVSGTADYAMLAIVADSFLACGIEGRITVLDICATPLRLCQWYAEQTGLAITVCHGDILEQPEAGYDLICTHSFLGQFAPVQRRLLAAAWHRLLVPGGRVLSLNRVRPDAGAEIAFAPAQADAFERGLLARLASSDLAGTLDTAAIGSLARYYVRQRIHVIHDEAEIAHLLQMAGLVVDYLASAVLAPATAIPAGPTLRDGARYAFFVARRSDSVEQTP